MDRNQMPGSLVISRVHHNKLVYTMYV